MPQDLNSFRIEIGDLLQLRLLDFQHPVIDHNRSEHHRAAAQLRQLSAKIEIARRSKLSPRAGCRGGRMHQLDKPVGPFPQRSRHGQVELIG